MTEKSLYSPYLPEETETEKAEGLAASMGGYKKMEPRKLCRC
jgi:hypothetical protein